MIQGGTCGRNAPDRLLTIALRLREKASQAVFAAYLNTSVSTVQKWEVGEKSPSGPALKLLDLVERKGLKALS